MKGQKIRLNFNGKEYTVKELAEITGLSRDAVIKRLARCKTFEEIIAPKDEPRFRKYNIRGKEYTLDELCKITGLLPTGMRNRLRYCGEGPVLLDPIKRRFKRNKKGE